MTTQRHPRSRRGASTFELVLIVFFSMLIIMLGIDAGRLMQLNGHLSDLSHATARASAAIGTTENAETFFNERATGPLSDARMISASPGTCSSADDIVEVRAEMDTEFAFNLGFVWGGSMPTPTLRSSATSACEIAR